MTDPALIAAERALQEILPRLHAEIAPELKRVETFGMDQYRRKFYRRVPISRLKNLEEEASQFCRDVDSALRIERFRPLDPDSEQLNVLRLPHLSGEPGTVAVRTPEDGGESYLVLKAYAGVAPKG